MTRPTDQGQAGSGWRAAGRAAARTAATAIAAIIVFPAIGAGSTAASAAAHRAGRAAAAGGSLRAWGYNKFGQLGDGTTTNSDTPVKVQLPAGTRVTSMRAGCGHTLALTTTGHVLAWGYNNDGELGDNTTTSSLTPVKVKLPKGTKVKAIRAGCRHSLALTTKGHVLAWGFGGDGELGIGSTLSAPEPVRVKLPKGTKVKGISAGAGHSLAFTATGRLYAWGYNGDGELGDGTTTNADTPVRVKLPKGIKVTLIGAGAGHSLARTSTGKVLAWGDNTDGDLGNGTTTGSLTAVRVKLPSRAKVRALFGGCAESLARTAKGRVLAWGDNSLGELGNGTTTNSLTPVRVKLPAGAKVTAVAAGCGHNLALTARGHVLAWGDNQVGELGNGTTTNSDLPVRVESRRASWPLPSRRARRPATAWPSCTRQSGNQPALVACGGGRTSGSTGDAPHPYGGARPAPAGPGGAAASADGSAHEHGHAAPCQVAQPAFKAQPAISSATTPSSHHQPSAVLATKPTKTAPARQAQSRF